MAGTSVCSGRLRGAMQLGCLEGDPGLGGDDAGAEVAVERVDEGHGGALRVDDGEIDRVGARRPRDRAELGVAFLAVDAADQVADQGVAQHVLHRHVGHVGVGHERIAHGISQPRHLHQHVVALG